MELNGVYVINLDEYSDIGTHWLGLYALNNTVTYFDSFGEEHIPNEIKRFIERSLINKSLIEGSSITANIYRIQSYDSVTCDIFALDLLIFCFTEAL